MSDLPRMDRELWVERSSEEVAFWERWIQSEGSNWPEDFLQRTDPEKPLAEMVESLLAELRLPTDRTIDILDIGAGPISMIGGKSKAYETSLTVVDPLADEYNRMLDEAGIRTTVRPTYGTFETAIRDFGSNRFDIVWCFNSLDHSMDPLLGLFNLLSMCRVGGALVLGFHPNEASGAGYHGLHQWNLDLEGKNVTLSQKDRQLSLTPLLDQQDVLSVWQHNASGSGSKGRVVVRVRKTGECNLSQAYLA